MRKHVKGNVSWVGYIDWELESFHVDISMIRRKVIRTAALLREPPLKICRMTGAARYAV